jgi:uncharacterized protein
MRFSRWIIRRGDATMPRPPCCRKVEGPPRCSRFEPRGGVATDAGPVLLGLDELEALRLADVESLEQEPAAKRMGVSRPTFGRILGSARRKVAQALVGGRGLRIEGGPVRGDGESRHTCGACGHRWAGGGAAGPCPRCRGKDARPCGCGPNKSIARNPLPEGEGRVRAGTSGAPSPHPSPVGRGGKRGSSILCERSARGGIRPPRKGVSP